MAQDWDDLYGEAPIWSGNPNGALVHEVSSLPPGRALDVGCGEGADAVWLARRGWQVTGLDISAVALARAATHARQAGVEVSWLHSGLTEASLPPQSFDLVSAQYPALLATTDHAAEQALLDAVAPGGVLLFVHHDVDPDHHGYGFDPRAFVLPPQMTAILSDEWHVEVDEKRARDVPAGGNGAHHTADVVLRVRRRTQ